MKCKIYITDEGFGPIVRQSAIIEEMRQISPSLKICIQTKNHFNHAKKLFKNVSLINKYNLVSWQKNFDGTPDIFSIKNHFKKYLENSDDFIKEDLKDFNHDFVITDFVYEAFAIGANKKIPSFGVAHFTWDWFFSKLYPPPLETMVLQRFFDYANQADALYFPPFTPQEILNHYKKKSKAVPLIVRKINGTAKKIPAKKFNILVMDSGAGVLTSHISNALSHLNKLGDFHFFISSAMSGEKKNITPIDKNELFIDYIPQMDLVIGRAGFNTISECIAYRTPMLLLSEGMNPEMNENIVNIKKAGLGSFISIEEFSSNLHRFLPGFIKHEYKIISENMKSHEYRSDGAKIVAEDILNRVKS